MTEPILYTLRVPRPQWHEVEVEARVPTGGQPAVELMMAVWTPGSYLVREFARHVEQIAASAEDGAPLPIEKVAKNRWRVRAGEGCRRVVVTYRLYARELTVRTNFVDTDFALINGAATFVTLAGDYHRPHEVRMEPPDHWQVVVTTLPEIEPGKLAWRAADFAQLVDSPIYAGNAPVHRFEVAGRPHLLVNEGDDGTGWDGARSAAEAELVVRRQVDFWGCVPYSQYVFFNLIAEGGTSGLEHGQSSVLMTSRWRTRSREGWLEWLSLVGHELFHAWNVKQLRPAELDDVNYEHEVYTRSLWQVEGVTSYYDDLLVHRAGLSTRAEYLGALGKQIATLETTPGRRVQPLSEASFDAWIKYYRRDENFTNSSVSYYTKGAVVSFLLDVRVRRLTGGKRSLDDVMRLAYRQFSGSRGYRPEEIQAAASEVAAVDLGPWFAAALDSTADLDYQEAIDWLGLRLGGGAHGGGAGAGNGQGGGKEAAGDESPAWLGIDTEMQGGRLLVSQIQRGAPAHQAGLNVGDEILAFGDYRVPADGLRERLKCFRPGAAETLLVARRERLVRLPVVFGSTPNGDYRLSLDPRATPEQRCHLDAWLGTQQVKQDPTPQS